MIVIAVPVLNRPQNAAPLAESVAAATTVPYRLVFVTSPGDTATIGACRATGADVAEADWRPGTGDYAKKINLAYRASTEPFLFQGADDLTFELGWDIAALGVIEEAETGVCGTNDQANPQVMAGKHATHSLIRRAYVDECGAALEGPGVVLSEVYSHQFCDNELVDLARSRECFSFAERSIVTHRHPYWGTAVDDRTYQRGRAGYHADRKLYAIRSREWATAL